MRKERVTYVGFHSNQGYHNRLLWMAYSLGKYIVQVIAISHIKPQVALSNELPLLLNAKFKQTNNNYKFNAKEETLRIGFMVCEASKDVEWYL